MNESWRSNKSKSFSSLQLSLSLSLSLVWLNILKWHPKTYRGLSSDRSNIQISVDEMRSSFSYCVKELVAGRSRKDTDAVKYT